MDLYFLISALFGMCSVVFGAGLAAPTEHPRALSTTHSDGGVHVRTKRCSCATFLDKECVYFCHLDIIWVNTPERVVSYGLGNAPRSRRSVPGSENAESPERPRCMCLRRDDRTCQSFCRPQKRTHREKSENMSSVHSSDCSNRRCQHPPPLTLPQSGPEPVLSPEAESRGSNTNHSGEVEDEEKREEQTPKAEPAKNMNISTFPSGLQTSGRV